MIKRSFFFGLLLLAPGFGLAASDDAVGRVILANGQVEAIAPTGSSRMLSRRDAVREGEIIRTGGEGLVQIRFADNNPLVLLAGSELEIRRFDHDGPKGEPDRAIYYLRRGGVRTITGGIGNAANDEYRMETDFGVITTNGGTFACQVDQALICGAYDGGITMSNAGGSLLLGLGSNYNYAMVPAPSARPEPLLQKPAQL